MPAPPEPLAEKAARAPSIPAPRRNILRFAAISIALFCAGCRTPPPTPEEAARALLATEPFLTARIETAESSHPGRCPAALDARPDWNRWLGLGLAHTSEIATSSGPVCRLILEESVRREAESWGHRIPRLSGGGEDIVLPVAVRALIRVSEIRPAGRGVADTVFEWQWRPNQAGQKLGVDSSPHTATARLILSDSGWRASGIEVGER